MRRAAIVLVLPLVLVIGWCARPDGGAQPAIEVEAPLSGAETPLRRTQRAADGVDDARAGVVTSAAPQPEVADVRPGPRRSVLRGRVVDGAGSPRAGAVILVYVEVAVSEHGGARASIEARHVTGADGRFVFRGLAPGAKKLNITSRAASEFAARDLPVVQRAGVDHDLGDITATSPDAMAFDIRVVDAAGAPVDEAVVTIGPYEGAGRTRVFGTGADGKAKVRGWRPRGYFRVEVRADGYLPALIRIVPAAQVYLLRPALDDTGERIKRTGERIITYGGARAEARIVLLRPGEDGRCAVRIRVGSGERWVVSLLDGSEVASGALVDGEQLVRLAPGEYRLCAARLRLRENRRSDPVSRFEHEGFSFSRLIVPAAAEHEMGLSAAVRGVSITGRVVRDDEPAAHVSVALVDGASGKAWGWPTSTDADGVFHLVVPEGATTLELAHAGTPSRYPVDASAGVVVDEDGREYRDVGVLRLASR